jgi:GT2 family glycosyltransferase
LPAELLVVDNGSTDETGRIVRQIHPANLSLRMIQEPSAGKSHACNRALAEAAGEILLFTDDDVLVGPDWIEGMCRPILEFKADAVAGGVRFPPELDRQVRICRSWFACTAGIIPDRPDRFVGANMAFRRDVLEQVPGFDTELGPGALGFGEETLFAFQLREAGFRLVARFDTAVEHHFDPARLTRPKMLQMARQMGRSKAYVLYHWRHEEIPRGRMANSVKRLFRWPRFFATEHHFKRELEAVEKAAMAEYLAEQAGCPRRYARRGLIKLNLAPPIERPQVRESFTGWR